MNSQASRRSPSAALILALISIPIFIGALDLTVVSAVLPHVIYDLEIPLQSGLDNAAWIVSGYLLAYTIAMTFMGRMSDIYGRRRIYLLALAVFAAGSYLVAVADAWPTRLALRVHYLVADGRPDSSMVALSMIIVARMIQAFGAGAMVPIGMAMVGDLYPQGHRARPLGIIAAVDTAGWVVGHLYGGIIVRYLDWRMIFWLNLPICLIAFALIAYVLRRFPRSGGVGRMDWVGAALVATGLGCITLGLGGGAESSITLSFGEAGAQEFINWRLLILALFVLLAYMIQQSRARHPLIALSMFRKRNFTVASVVNLLVGFSLFVAIVSVPLFINTLIAETIEQGAWDSGWMLSALTVPMAFAAIPSGWITERYGYRWPSIAGMVMTIGGFSLMTQWRAMTPYATMVPHLVLTGVGFGLAITPIAAAVVNASESSYRGSASALVIIFRLLGMTVAVSSMTSYGLQRITALSATMIEPGSSYEELYRVGVEVAERVIGEMFIIAAAMCMISTLLLFRLSNIGDRRRDQNG